MGLCLADTLLLAQVQLLGQLQLLAISWDSLGGYVYGGLQAALGLGVVIFVHELGHFAVAKWCGVQCDKFMIGFDIGGYKIGRQWGDTYYGIGVLPLGGYVKMMGQDDDPSKFAEQARESQAMADDPNAKEIIGPNGEKVWVDRRSYMAKNVPQRMAIISAGVIMNVIFAFVFAFFAFGMGVPRLACVLGATAPGGAAWQANLRTGDQITRIGGVSDPTFDALTSSVMLGDMDQGVQFDVTRANGGSLTNLTLKPRFVGKLPQVGVFSSRTLRVAEEAKPGRHTPAGKASVGFEGGDVITAVNGVAVGSYADLVAQELPMIDQPVTYTVQRGGAPPEDDPFGPVQGGEQATVTLEANARERLGIVATMGPITAIQQDSPAADSDLRVGDRLLGINGVAIGAASEGETSWDPLNLDMHLAKLAASGEATTLRVQRGDADPFDVPIAPRRVTWIESPSLRAPMALPALGIACQVDPVVAAIVEGSPAQQSDLQPGDKISKADILIAGESVLPRKKPLLMGPEETNWPFLISSLQDLGPEAKVELTVTRGEKTHGVTLSPVSVDNAFSFGRGVPLDALQVLQEAGSIGEQASMALTSTYRSLTQVLRFLQKIGSQVPVGAIGGPLTILDAGAASANQGVSTLLLFLTMLSANLAVLNFLPIPVLDGGHMVFLAYEGLRGRPANEKFVMTMQLCGMAFLLSLMIFVFGLDLNLIDRGL